MSDYSITKERTLTQGTGTYTLDGVAMTGFRTFDVAVAAGHVLFVSGQVCCLVTDGVRREIVRGIYSAGPHTLTRESIVASTSASGIAPIDWGPGPKEVMLLVDSGVLDYIQPSSGAVYRPPQLKSLEFVTVGDFDALGDDSTDNTSFFQKALDSLTNGGTLFVTRGVFRVRTLRVNYEDITIQMLGGAVLSFPVLGRDAAGIIPNANNFKIYDGELRGPSANTYVSGEHGIKMVGISTSERKSGLTVIGTEITQFGSAGVYAQFVDQVHVERDHIHHCGYQGAVFISCNHGKARDNDVEHIAPGTAEFYAFRVSAANATAGATYTNSGVTFTVMNTIAGTTVLFCTGASVPAASGTLTKTSGTGDATIAFSSYVYIANAYGMVWSHDSTAYSADPHAGTKAAANPFCWDWTINGNTVQHVAWSGLDCHGGYEMVIDGNHTYACFNGVSCSNSSGDAAAYAGNNNKVINNIVDAANEDGAPSGYENLSFGMNVAGGTIAKQQRLECNSNTVIGYGLLGNGDSGAIQAGNVENASLNKNTIQKWGGNAVYLGSSTNLEAISNRILELGGAAAGEESCFKSTATSLGKTLTLTNNVCSANGGTAARNGFNGPSVTTFPYFDNDFAAATNAAYVLSSGLTVSAINVPTLSVTVNNNNNTTGTPIPAEDVSIAALSRYKEVRVSITSSNALSVIKDFTDGVESQTLHLYNPGATAWTFNRNAAALDAAADFVAGQYDAMTVFKASALWIERTRAANS